MQRGCGGRRRWWTTAVAVAAVAAACASADGDDREEEDFDPVLAEMGAEVFAARCATCHGVSATGDGPSADTLKVPPADLTRIAARRGGTFPDGEVSRIIDGRFDLPAHGTREMPIWGERFSESIPESGLGDELARGRIATLVEYLKSIQRPD